MPLVELTIDDRPPSNPPLKVAINPPHVRIVTPNSQSKVSGVTIIYGEVTGGVGGTLEIDVRETFIETVAKLNEALR